ncbi:MAG TPA: L-histidine N(alpha)-methyltransferase [Vicinamibacterales bacterium]|nr:L-histidine N(alpha)-methyltransferase [Vicinamibacterales bacterium]
MSYVTRTERRIPANEAVAIIAAATGHRPGPLRLVEPGAGAASKIAILLDAVVSLRGEAFYMPIDVSSDALEFARERIASSFPEVRVEPIVARYVTHLPPLASIEGTSLAVGSRS